MFNEHSLMDMQSFQKKQTIVMQNLQNLIHVTLCYDELGLDVTPNDDYHHRV